MFLLNLDQSCKISFKNSNLFSRYKPKADFPRSGMHSPSEIKKSNVMVENGMEVREQFSTPI